MKKSTMILLGVIGIPLVLAFFWFSFYFKTFNKLVVMEENVNLKWAQVENQMQRRYDLIPNLVNTVKGYAKHEKELFENIAESRSKLAGANTQKDKIAASNGLEGALSRLLVVVERYPDLKANTNFTRLMDELAGSENRLAVERKRYNEAVQAYNASIRMMPTSIVANMKGFKRKEVFQVEEKAKEAPKVDFGS